ncbi:hypothetical protein CB1_000436036 [Camelus ferus]|nr:hypothetical protein CB1_000436036 [Camelus ferus]
MSGKGPQGSASWSIRRFQAAPCQGPAEKLVTAAVLRNSNSQRFGIVLQGRSLEERHLCLPAPRRWDGMHDRRMHSCSACTSPPPGWADLPEHQHFEYRGGPHGRPELSQHTVGKYGPAGRSALSQTRRVRMKQASMCRAGGGNQIHWPASRAVAPVAVESLKPPGAL